MAIKDVILLDTETTGVRFEKTNPELNDKMWQLSLSKAKFDLKKKEFIKNKDGSPIIESKTYFFNDPETIKKLENMDPNILQKLNITSKTINTIKEQGAPLKDCIKEIQDFIGDNLIIAYNGLGFDKKVLDFSNIATDKNSWLDPMLMAHILLPHSYGQEPGAKQGFEKQNIKLTSVFSQLMNVSNLEIAEKAHDAEFDVYMLTSVFEKLLQLSNKDLNDFIYSPNDLKDLNDLKSIILMKSKNNKNVFLIDCYINSNFSRVITKEQLEAFDKFNYTTWIKDNFVAIPKDKFFYVKDNQVREKGIKTSWLNNSNNELTEGNLLYAAPLLSTNYRQQKEHSKNSQVRGFK